MTPLLRTLALVLAALPATAAAHSFGTLYTLPIPVSMYLYGTAAALAVSFMIIGYFVSTPDAARRNLATQWVPALDTLSTRWLKVTLTVGSMLLLGLTMITGWFGVTNPFANFSMVFFWIIFVLGYAYCVAALGNSYDAINPWRAIPDLCNHCFRGSFDGRVAYPKWLGYWPAFGLYFAFIWAELFGSLRASDLATMLAGYLVMSIAGAWVWGRDNWFRYCDFFGVFFRLLGMISPIQRVQGRFRLRHPFMGLIERPCESFSLLMFLLFMLASTAYDGIHKTVPWVSIYWQDLVGVVRPMIGGTLVETFPKFKAWYLWFQTATLLLSPVVYLLAYLIAAKLMQWFARSKLSLRALCMQFAFTLVPIAFVYHVTHYYTLLQTQGPLLLKLVSDPFGWGWNLFGTADWFTKPILPDVGVVWHVQVALILIGHIVSVYLAHMVALRLFANPRQALLSQLPMLILMMIYTASGLWILGQPIQGGVMVPAVN